MKTRIFKTSMPIAMFLLAIVGAFASQASVSKPLTPQIGYIDAPSPCTVQARCNTVVAPFCTLMFQGSLHQAYGKVNPDDATCTKILYRN